MDTKWEELDQISKVGDDLKGFFARSDWTKQAEDRLRPRSTAIPEEGSD